MPGELIRREALERIIQRAAELQAGERDIGEGLTEADVLALGQDVGIPTRYLRQALLEEQTRSVVTGGTGLFAWLTGPSLLTAERGVPGDRVAVERALTVWMEREESLQVKRRYAGRTTWEPPGGAFASIQRAPGPGRQATRSSASPRNSRRARSPPPRGRGPGASWLIPVRERNDRDTAGRGAGVRPDGERHRAGRRHRGLRDDGARCGAARLGQGTRGNREIARQVRREGETRRRRPRRGPQAARLYDHDGRPAAL